MSRTKRIMGVLFLSFLLGLVLSVSAFAGNEQKIQDLADLLTDSEESELQELFTGLVRKWDMDVVYATVPSIYGEDPQTAAEDFYDNNDFGIGEDWAGVILFVNIGERDVNVTAEGSAQRAFTGYALDMVREQVTPDLSDGEFCEAGKKFAALVDKVFQAEADGNPYDYGNRYKEPMAMSIRLLISAGVGLIAALIVFLIFWSQLTSVHTATEAAKYIKDGSFNVTRSNDLFLYNTVTKTKIESDSSSGGGSHTTSAGHSASGSSGKF